MPLWIHSGSAREKNTHACTCTHTRTIVRFGQDFVAAKSCVEGMAVLTPLRLMMEGKWTVCISPAKEKQDQGNVWLRRPAAPPHWRNLKILSFAVFPWPWQHSLIFLFWMPSAPRVPQNLGRTQLSCFCFWIGVSFFFFFNVSSFNWLMSFWLLCIFVIALGLSLVVESRGSSTVAVPGLLFAVASFVVERRL